MLAKFHGNILNLSENITKSFRGATFLTHNVHEVSNWRYLSGPRPNIISSRVTRSTFRMLIPV